MDNTNVLDAAIRQAVQEAGAKDLLAEKIIVWIKESRERELSHSDNQTHLESILQTS